MPDIKLEAFPPGQWRLDLHGAIAVPPHRKAPMVRLLISQEHGPKPRQSRTIEVGAEALPILHLGKVWTDGVRGAQAVDVDETHNVSVNIDANSMSVTNAWGKDNGMLLLSPQKFVVPQTFARMPLLHFRRPRIANDRVGDLLVPCSEVFRTYFGVSPVITMLLQGQWAGPGLERVFDAKRTFITTDYSEVLVVLGRKIPNKYGPVVARMIFDSHSGLSIDGILRDSIAASRHSSGAYNLVCTPPFRGPANWTVRGQAIGTTQWPRFLVQQIVSCDRPMPFEHAQFYRDNIGGSPTLINVPRTAYAGVRKLFKSSELDVVHVFEDADPGQQSIPQEFVDYEDVPAYRTDGFSIDHLKNENPKTRSASRIMHVAPTAPTFSTGSGVRGSSHIGFSTEKVIQSEGDPNVPGTLQFFRETMRALHKSLSGSGHSVDVKLQTIGFTWPQPEYPSVPWSRFEPRRSESRARRACEALLVIDGAGYTFWEIERRRIDDSQPTIGITAHPTADERGRIFYCLALGRGNINERDWQSLMLPPETRYRIEHRGKPTATDYAQRIVNHIGYASSADDHRSFPDTLLRSISA